jgi:hypothetical protein
VNARTVSADASAPTASTSPEPLMAGLTDPAAATLPEPAVERAVPTELVDDMVAAVAEPDLPASSADMAGQPYEVTATGGGLFAWRCRVDPSGCVAGGIGGIGEVAVAAARHSAEPHPAVTVTDDPVVNGLDRIEVQVETLTARVEEVASEVRGLALEVRDLTDDTTTAARCPGGREIARYAAEVVSGVAVLVLICGALLPVAHTLPQWVAVGLAMAVVGYLTARPLRLLTYAVDVWALGSGRTAAVYALAHDDEPSRIEAL